MSEVDIQAVLGPQYEIVIANDVVNIGDGFALTLSQQEPLRINVGTGYNVNQSSTGTLDVTIIAQEVVNAFRAITYDGYFCQTSDITSLSKYAGVTRMATVIGDPINVVRDGLMTEAGWTWTPDQPIFIGNDGVLVQTPVSGQPIRRIGWAISATQINLDPYPIIGV